MADGPLVADTDVILEFLRGRDPGSTVRNLFLRGHLRITAVTAFELRLGADFFDREYRIIMPLVSQPTPKPTSASFRFAESLMDDVAKGIPDLVPGALVPSGMAGLRAR
ncbi:MAG TPA: hypothetical protein VFF07_14280 [Actinomycetota bacterium]|nr:hypothetical protein [Actinomycetota bacterium]